MRTRKFEANNQFLKLSLESGHYLKLKNYELNSKILNINNLTLKFKIKF